MLRARAAGVVGDEDAGTRETEKPRPPGCWAGARGSLRAGGDPTPALLCVSGHTPPSARPRSLPTWSGRALGHSLAPELHQGGHGLRAPGPEPPRRLPPAVWVASPLNYPGEVGLRDTLLIEQRSWPPPVFSTRRFRKTLTPEGSLSSPAPCGLPPPPRSADAKGSLTAAPACHFLTPKALRLRLPRCSEEGGSAWAGSVWHHRGAPGSSVLGPPCCPDPESPSTALHEPCPLPLLRAPGRFFQAAWWWQVSVRKEG